MTALHFCTSESWGGLELYASTLISELQKSGCTSIAVCKPHSKVEAFLLERGVECIHLPNYSKVSFSSLRFVNELLNRRKIEVVHVHFHKDIWIPSMALRNDRHCRLFLSVYMGVFSKNDILHRWIYRRVNAIFTSSHRLNAILPERYPVPKEKIHYLAYGRRLERYRTDSLRRSALRRHYGVREDELLVGTMVRIDPGKGALDFARSFSYLEPSLQSKVKYIIVGEPTRMSRSRTGESPYEPGCVAYLQEINSFIEQSTLSGKILMAGFQEDVVGTLSAMDVFVFPSRDELYSLVMLDAMAMQLPVVAANAGGNLEQVSDGATGLLYEVGDSKALAKQVECYAQDAGLRKRHGSAARQFVESHHDMETTINQLVQYYSTPS
ncbi:MAG TPA: glycosyltransferase family 4 protein [Bacteroidota bacterium]|nr:glycosyltransferase family 4 protein [Bacteroidota bacterium]